MAYRYESRHTGQIWSDEEATQREEFINSNGLKIVVVVGDILTLRADALIVAETLSLTPLNDASWRYFKEASIKLDDFKNRFVILNTVVRNKIYNFYERHEAYIYVFHALVDPTSLSSTNMNELVQNIVMEAKKHSLVSVAMPLLTDDVSDDSVVDDMIYYLSEARTRYLETVYIVTQCFNQFKQICKSAQIYLRSTTTPKIVSNTETSAEINHAKACKTYATRTGLNIHVLVGDVLKINANAFVTAESPDLDSMSQLFQQYCHQTNQSAEDWRTKLKQLKTLLPSRVHVEREKSKMEFIYIFLACVHPYYSSMTRGWFSNMSLLYDNIIYEAEQRHLLSITMPILTTENVPHGYAIDAAIQSLFKLHTRYPDDIYLVASTKEEFEKICHTCERERLRSVADTYNSRATGMIRETRPEEGYTNQVTSDNRHSASATREKEYLRTVVDTNSSGATAMTRDNHVTSHYQSSSSGDRQSFSSSKSQVRPGTSTETEGMKRTQRFTTKSGIDVIVSKGDILKSGTQALITGENLFLNPQTIVFKKICKMEGIDTDKWIQNINKQGAYFRSSNVYVGSKPRHVSFEYIFHAIVPYYVRKTNWLTRMGDLYNNIISQLTDKKITSITMPVFNNVSAPDDVAIEATVCGLAKMPVCSLKKVHLVSRFSEKFKNICNACEKKFPPMPENLSNGAVSKMKPEASNRSNESFKPNTTTSIADKTSSPMLSQQTRYDFPNVDASKSMVDKAKSKEGIQKYSSTQEDLRTKTSDSTFTSYAMSSRDSPPSDLNDKRSSQSFVLQNGLELTVHLQDILTIKATAIVTGESADLRHMSFVTQQLCEQGGIVYNQWRDELLDKYKRLKYGKVYKMVATTNLCYFYSFHAIMYGYTSGKEDHWASGMDEIYSNIIRKAEKIKAKSIVMPLLGSGRAGAPVELAITVALNSLSAQDTHYLKEVHMALVEKDIFKLVLDECRDIKNPSQNHQNNDSPTYVRKSDQLTSDSSSCHPRNQSAHVKHHNYDETISPTLTNNVSKHDALTKYIGDSKGVDTTSLNTELGLKELREPTLTASHDKTKHTEETERSNIGSGYGHNGIQPSGETSTGNDVLTKVKTGSNDATAGSPDTTNETCAICMDDVSDPKKLDKCGHVFCRDCIDRCFKDHKPVCPTCNTIYGAIIGTQPEGSMTYTREYHSLPGHPDCGTIMIKYHFNGGIQGPEHPNPGSCYRGTTRRAFLPDSNRGKKVLHMLELAFKRKVTFTIGRSSTTGREDVITWNDIHHKTREHGGPNQYGYPDPEYLSRVTDELATKGITEADL